MSQITFLENTLVAGIDYAPGDTLELILSESRGLIGTGNARFTNGWPVRIAPFTGAGPLFMPSITALTGGGEAGLDCLLLADVPIGAILLVAITGETAPRMYRAIAKSGESPNGDSIVEPPDFDADENNKLWLRVQ